jgi:hypothetical protein
VQTGSGLLRSHRRSAKSLASMMSYARANPLEPSPVAKQAHAEASEGANVSKEPATTNAVRIRPISSSSGCSGAYRIFLFASFGQNKGGSFPATTLG